MKKIIALFTGVLFSIVAFGQHLDNEMYFRFGYSNPSWSQFGLDKSNWMEAGIDSKIGGSFEFGTIFMINRLLAADNMAIGIDADYLCINYSKLFSNSNGVDINLDHLRVGSKLGPSFTYSPVEKLAFDIYFKAGLHGHQRR